MANWQSPPGLLTPSSFLLSLAGIFICHKIVAVFRAKQAIGFFPGQVFVIFPGAVISNFVLPRIPGISAGKNHLLIEKHQKYKELGQDVYSVVSYLPTVQTVLIISDAATIKQVTSSRAMFPKPIKRYESLAVFGQNIVVSEGEAWKKYRKIVAPAFSEKHNRLVWDETVRVVEGLFELWDATEGTSTTVDHCLDIVLPMTLFVIGATAFGQRMLWTDNEECPDGHTMTFKESLQIVAYGVFVKLAVPEWAMGLTARTRTVRKAFDELELYMKDMIHERTNGEKVEKHDLFSSLLKHNGLDSDALTDQELVANIFMFLIAGHETTAHTLCFSLAHLALYPSEQERLVEHVHSVCPDGNFTYSDVSKLTHSLAVFYETLRLFPPVVNVPKSSAEDTTLTTTNARGEKVEIPVPKGTDIMLNSAGLHYNPRYWEDPFEFKPERFLRDYPKDAFIPFSGGVRSCIGKKFSETEAVAILSKLVHRYKITVKEEPQFAHETFDERKERILRNHPGITVTPICVPLVFTRRT